MVGTIVTQNLSVSPQISVDMLDDIKAAGFTQIICNRPDGESLDQTDFSIIEKRASELGLVIIHQPITPPTLNAQNAQAFLQMVNKGEKTFAYCRTGTRSIMLWSIGSALAGGDIAQIAQTAMNAGYDVSGALAQFA
jgi:sulfide:quinone oxidoreductase